MILIPIPSNNQSHKFLSGVQDFHLKGYSLASDLYGIFAVKEDKKVLTTSISKFNNLLRTQA